MRKSKRPTCGSSTIKVADPCLIDTSAWVDFFRGHEPLASTVDALLADGRAALCGMVELEIRQALRQREEDLLNLLGATVRLSTTEEDYAQAGELLADLRRGGMTLPATDGLIAQVALRHGVSLLENDRHFEHIETLKRAPWRVKGDTR
jgi:predicted nucleic acid-binding protein